ncbi:hypothetical protein M514_03280 [Trichuris suis]|uniref:Uncharacterized protein n=1 Tax=Trichuris suis TaxID=68888 RepID=A0A085NL47_9BILA|nr:hypothetical protein M514_03280 [Trichuris suis]
MLYTMTLSRATSTGHRQLYLSGLTKPGVGPTLIPETNLEKRTIVVFFLSGKETDAVRKRKYKKMTIKGEVNNAIIQEYANLEGSFPKANHFNA